MENMSGRVATGQAQPFRQLVYEDFQPSSAWTHDTNAHVLLIELPGFKKEDVKLQVDNFGKITVSGERLVSESKCSRFKQIFNVPKDSNIETISGKFDHGLLFVIMPKKEIERIEELQKKIQNDSTETEGKPTNKDEESREDAQNDITKKEGNATNKETEPKEEIQNDSSKKEGKPTNKERQLKEEIQNDSGKKEGKPTNKDKEPKEEIQHDSTTKEGKSINKEESKKEDSDDDNHGPKDGVDHEKGEGQRNDGKEGLKGESGERYKRKGNLSEGREKVMEEEMKDDLFNQVMETISQNKALIATAMVAFSFGLYISHKLRKTE